MNWFTVAGAGGRRAGGTRPGGDQMNGNAVMYDTGKILALAGAPDYENKPATTAASVITLTGNTASARVTTSLTYSRAFCMSVVLPDGKVVTTGGMPLPVPFDDTNARLIPGAQH
jgi:galactose oxidase